MKRLVHSTRRVSCARRLVEALRANAADPGITSEHVKMREICERLGRAQAEVERLYERWAELDARR